MSVSLPAPHSLKSVGAFVLNLAADSADDEEMRLQKQMLAGLTATGMCVLLVVGSLFLAIGAVAAGIIYLGYLVVNVVNMFLFGTGRLPTQRFVVIQIVLVIAVSIAATIALGGIANSGGVLFYGFLSPLAALLFFGGRAAALTLVVFLLSIAATVALTVAEVTTPILSGATALVILGINTSALCTMVYATVAYFVAQRNLAYRRLEQEEKKSERLLLNILPAGVAALLKDGDQTIARHYEAASILFADVVDFTPMAAGLEPTKVVDLLNEVFTEFDRLVEKYGLEKIKTIGDCYMVAAGVPEARDDHALVTVELAYEMMDIVDTRLFQGCRLLFRIGIHSGPVVAGVIGQRKFSYDLWGDTVNTASRMEEYGIPGQIQITETTRSLVDGRFVAEPRGEIEVKGKGVMPCYLLKRQPSFAPADAPMVLAPPRNAPAILTPAQNGPVSENATAV